MIFPKIKTPVRKNIASIYNSFRYSIDRFLIISQQLEECSQQLAFRVAILETELTQMKKMLAESSQQKILGG
jgi:hypothetical protein